MARDDDYIKLIHTSRWLRLRRDVLNAHPLCQRCEKEGTLTPSTEVHHIRPVEEALTYSEKMRLMYDASNLMALCHDCHVKVHTEMGRCGKDANRKRQDAHVKDVIRKFFDDG